MIVRFFGGPLAGLEWPMAPGAHPSGWYRHEGADRWTLYLRTADNGRGVVLVEAQEVTTQVQ